MENPRVFTLEEATELLPRVRQTVQKMQTAKHEADKARQEYDKLDETHARGNGYEVKREQLATKMVENAQVLRKGLDTLHQIGCELKDLEMGLIDFPSEREGQTINLCWKIDEEKIGYWHPLDSGFGSRQPL